MLGRLDACFDQGFWSECERGNDQQVPKFRELLEPATGTHRELSREFPRTRRSPANSGLRRQIAKVANSFQRDAPRQDQETQCSKETQPAAAVMAEHRTTSNQHDRPADNSRHTTGNEQPTMPVQNITTKKAALKRFLTSHPVMPSIRESEFACRSWITSSVTRTAGCQFASGRAKPQIALPPLHAWA